MVTLKQTCEESSRQKDTRKKRSERRSLELANKNLRCLRTARRPSLDDGHLAY